MESNRVTSANVAKYAAETHDKIFNNEIARDAGMREFYVDPTSFDSTPEKPTGFKAARDFI